MPRARKTHLRAGIVGGWIEGGGRARKGSINGRRSNDGIRINCWRFAERRVWPWRLRHAGPGLTNTSPVLLVRVLKKPPLQAISPSPCFFPSQSRYMPDNYAKFLVAF
jgi:hypothetical protein